MSKGRFEKPDSVDDNWPKITRTQTQAEKDLIQELTDPDDASKRDPYKKTIGRIIWAATERQRHQFGLTDRVSPEHCKHLADSAVLFAAGVAFLHAAEDDTMREKIFDDAISYAQTVNDSTTSMAVESLRDVVMKIPADEPPSSRGSFLS